MWLPLECPLLGNLAHNPGICPDWESNWRPFGSQTSTQSTEPYQPGLSSKSGVALLLRAQISLEQPCFRGSRATWQGTAVLDSAGGSSAPRGLAWPLVAVGPSLNCAAGGGQVFRRCCGPVHGAVVGVRAPGGQLEGSLAIHSSVQFFVTCFLPGRCWGRGQG